MLSRVKLSGGRREIRWRRPAPAGPGGPGRRDRTTRTVLLLLAALLALTGCQVHTTVAVTARPDGHGSVTVTVALDPAALAAIGGKAALAGQLRTADLTAAGWTVSGPGPGPGGTTVVAVNHGFSDLAQASALVGEVAGSGPSGERPFRLAVTTRHTYWATTTALTGTVDLRCGLACFGDSGLQSSLGSPVGADVGPLSQAARQSPGQLLTFEVTARLPGHLRSSNALMSSGGLLHWTPKLGAVESLTAETRMVQTGRIHAVEGAIAGGAALVLLVLLWLVWRLWRRRRRSRRDRAGDPTGSGGERERANGTNGRTGRRARRTVGAHSPGAHSPGTHSFGAIGFGAIGVGRGPIGGSAEAVTPGP